MPAPSLKIVPPVPPSVWLATLTLSLFGLAMPLVMLQIFDRIIPYQATETLLVLLLGLVVIVPLEMLQKLLRTALMNAQAGAHAEALSASILHRVLHAPKEALPSTYARLHSYLLSPSKIRDHMSGTGRLYLIELPFSAIGLVLIWMLAGPLVYVPLTGFTLLLAAAMVVRRVHRRNLSAREEADSQRYALFEQMIAHIHSVKANQLEGGLNNRFRKHQHRSVGANHAVYVSSNLFQSLAQSINLVFSAAIVCAGAYLVLQRQIGAAELAACTMLNGRAAQPLMNAIQHWTSSESFTKSRQTVAEALELPQTPALPRGKAAIARRGVRVSFDNVTLRRSQSGRAVLRNFSFDCDGGFVTLSSGATGNARAAFECLLGEAVPQKGAVLINGMDARHMARFRGQDGLVYIHDRPAMLEGSLIYNIALTEDAAIVDRAYEAAQALGLESDINKLPHGYNSDMRESGILMASRGFLQRINVARALTHQPAILLVDDAIAAMDQGMKMRTATALQSYARDHLVLAYDSSHLLERFADRSVCIATPSRSPAQMKRAAARLRARSSEAG